MRDFGVSSVTYYDLVRARLLERHPGMVRALMMLALILLACLAIYLMYDLVSFASNPDHEVLLAGIDHIIGGDTPMPTDGLAGAAGSASANSSQADDGNSSLDLASANLSRSNDSVSVRENNSSSTKSKKSSSSSKKSRSSSRSTSSNDPMNITDQNNISAEVSEANQTAISRANETAVIPIKDGGNNSNQSQETAPESWRDLLSSAVQDLINPEDVGSDSANQTLNSDQSQEKTTEPRQDLLSSAIQNLINPDDASQSGEPTATIQFEGDSSAVRDSGAVQNNEDAAVAKSVSSPERTIAATRQAQKVQEIRAKQAAINAKQSEVRSKQAAISAKQSEVRSKQAAINAKQSEVRSKQAAISAKQSEVRSKQADISTRQSEVGSGQSETNTPQSEVRARQSEAMARMKEKAADIRAR